MWGTIQLYIRKLLTALKRKFETSPTLTTVMFFTCLDKQGNSTAWKWLKDLFRQIERKIGLRIADTGEAADNSARLRGLPTTTASFKGGQGHRTSMPPLKLGIGSKTWTISSIESFTLIVIQTSSRT